MSDFFAVGATVFRSNGSQVKVVKVHKNGNIILEGSPQQYRSCRDYASATGGKWHSEDVYADTPENRAYYGEVARVNESRAIINAEIDRLTHIRQHAYNDPVNANAEADAIRLRTTKGE